MSTAVVTLNQGTPEWHTWRLGGIGGSDAPVIEGSSPYKTLRQLFFEKSGRPVESEDDDSKEYIFSLGHKTEGLIRREFSELMGIDIKPVCMERKDYPALRVSLDGFDSRHGVLEAKLVGAAVLKTALEQGEIPRHHWVQLQHAFNVSGADVGQWFGHNGKKQGALIEVRADKNFISKLQDDELKFYDDLLNGRVPSLSDRDYLIPEDQKLLIELRDAKEHAENAQARYEELKAQAVETYGHCRIAGGGLKIFKVVRKGSVDLLSVPEIASAVDHAKAGLDLDYLESFRKKDSESFSIRIDKPKEGA